MNTREGDEILEEAISGVGEPFGGKAAKSGASLAAKLLPTTEYKSLETIAKPLNQCVDAVTRELTTRGQLKTKVEQEQGTAMSGLLGTGFLKMNPALIEIKLTALEPGKTRVEITSAAKEGLIKQKTAEKAAKRILEILKEPSPQTATQTS